jgi:hypothetical protein
MAGLLHLIPRYLPRFGMAPAWVAFSRPLVLALLTIDIAVTVVFNANVEEQGGAYATGVLVLMFSAAVASAMALWHERHHGASLYGWIVAVIFGYTLIENIRERPDGIVIGSIFILIIIVIGGFSRYQRATELRVASFEFTDPESEEIWHGMIGKKVNLTPLRTNTREARDSKAREIRKYYAVGGPLAFVTVRLLDNRSEFFAPLRICVLREDENYLIEVSQAIAIANTIAYLSELLDPISIFLGLTRRNQMAQAFRFLLFGEGETGLMVYTILLRYWETTPEEDVRPLIFLMSE